jgi:uncharacterized membrane protein
MSTFPFFKQKSLFSEPEKESILEAIRNAERRTSGEIRVYIESRCKYVEPLDRAAELFYALKMENTTDRNGVLVYIAVKDHQLAIYADEGIHTRTGTSFWQKEVKTILADFNKHNYAAGLVTIVNDIGEALYQHFPYNREVDKNELPDDIVFGR